MCLPARCRPTATPKPPPPRRQDSLPRLPSPRGRCRGKPRPQAGCSVAAVRPRRAPAARPRPRPEGCSARPEGRQARPLGSPRCRAPWCRRTKRSPSPPSGGWERCWRRASQPCARAWSTAKSLLECRQDPEDGKRRQELQKMGSVRVDVTRSRDVGKVVHRPFQPAGAPLASTWGRRRGRPWGKGSRASRPTRPKRRGV